MRKILFLLSVSFCLGLGCGKPKVALKMDPDLLRLRGAVADGSYEEGLRIADQITSRVPPGPAAAEAFYLTGYIQIYGHSDFQGARKSFKKSIDLGLQGPLLVQAQRLLADCQYWQGHYRNAITEYKKLSAMAPESETDGYALLQTAHCLLLDDKVGDALTAYRSLVEKYPIGSLADSAQLMVANIYLKLQNWSQAKSELQKLVSISRNKDVQSTAQNVLRQIEEEEPFRKGVGVSE